MRSTIKGKLFSILALLLVVTTAAVAWISSRPFIEDNQNLILELDSQFSLRTAFQVRSYLKLIESQLIEGAEAFVSKRNLRSDSPFFSVIVLKSDAQGKLYPEKPYKESWLEPVQPYLMRASLGKIQIFPIPKDGTLSTLGYAVPYPEKNHLRSGRVILGLFSPGPLLDIINETEHGTVFIVNMKGALIVQSGNASFPWAADLSARPSVKSFLERQLNYAQNRTYEERAHRRFINSHRSIGNFGLGLISELPEATAFEATQRAEFRTVILAVLIVSIAFLIGSAYAETFTKPLSELVNATERLKRGEFNIALKIKGNDEIAALSRAFVSMASELKVHEEALINQEKLAVVGRMARSIGHEFGNVLQPLLTKLDLLHDSLKESGGSRSDIKKVDEMIEIASLGGAICKGLMTLSKESAHQEALFPFSLNEAVQKGLNLLAHDLKKRDISVDAKIPADLYILGVESQLIQILINFMVNSVHALEDGGKILIKAYKSQSRVFVEVSDNGCGIPEENLSKIFDPLFSTKGLDGNGLGLSISRSIVEASGGSIRVKSKVGEGTTIIVDFPEYKKNV